MSEVSGRIGISGRETSVHFVSGLLTILMIELDLV
jgi:hypothetical protein